MCLQLRMHRISSSSENSNRQTAQAQPFCRAAMSESPNLATGRRSRIRSADTEGGRASAVSEGRGSGQATSVSKKSESPRRWKRKNTRFRRRPRRASVCRNGFGKNTST
ncbi:hypothetical protein HKD37_07G018340 [Glycine soja]